MRRIAMTEIADNPQWTVAVCGVPAFVFALFAPNRTP
jgi:hypothetical protein